MLKIDNTETNLKKLEEINTKLEIEDILSEAKFARKTNDITKSFRHTGQKRNKCNKSC
jgi:hypothetical protein